MKVIFIHWGESDYLSSSIQQAKKWGNDVVLIKDSPKKRESMEIDRWFVLLDYMKSNCITRCLYLDSDVILYKNPVKDFKDCDLAFSKSHSGHTMFINNIGALADFCTYMNTTPFTKEMVDKTRERNPGGVFVETPGDMVYLNNFMFDSGYLFMDTSKIYKDSVYDHNINTEGLPITINGLPYRPVDGRMIKLNSIHFQGNAKGLIKDYV